MKKNRTFVFPQNTPKYLLQKCSKNQKFNNCIIEKKQVSEFAWKISLYIYIYVCITTKPYTYYNNFTNKTIQTKSTHKYWVVTLMYNENVLPYLRPSKLRYTQVHTCDMISMSYVYTTHSNNCNFLHPLNKSNIKYTYYRIN